MFIFTSIILIIICILLWVIWWIEVKNGSGPMMAGSLPVIGYTHKFAGDTEKLWYVIKDLCNFSLANGGFCRAIIALKTYYVISDPEELAIVGNTLFRKHFVFDFAKPWLGEGLLTASTSEWKNHRKLLSPAFSLSLLNSFLPILNEEARYTVETMAKEVVNQGPKNLSHYYRDNATRNLCRTSLDLSLHEMGDQVEEFVEAAENTLKHIALRFQNAWLHSDFIYWLTGKKREEDERIRVMYKMSNRIIEAKMSQLKTSSKNEEKHKPFLNLLLELCLENKLTQKDLVDEVQTILVAGTDTSTWMLNNLSVMLGTYPSIQQKVLDEITGILGDSDRDVTKEDVQKMVYTEAAIKESIRLYPAASVSLRTVEQGVQLKNHYLRPGEHVILAFDGVNRHPTAWGPDPEQFRPERWLGADSWPKAFAGFGLGKRNCIGRTYAIMAMKVLIAHVVRRYHMSADGTKLTFRVDFVTKPLTGHLVSLTERKKEDRKD